MQKIRPSDVQLGNFINCFGETVVVTGITPREDGSFYISHSGTRKENPVFGHGIEFSGFPIVLNNVWRKALHIEKYTFPGWLKYVHEAQNYVRWVIGDDTLAYFIDWSLIPMECELPEDQ